MKTIQIQNLKSIKQSPKIELKDINVFIGKNSCGKSTFLRTFPLFKQSIEKSINGPILWYGDYVDFGDFKNSLNSNCLDDETINFTFGIELRKHFYHKKNLFAEVSIFLNEKYVEKYVLRFGENKVIRLVRNANDKYDAFVNDTKIANVEFSPSNRNNLFLLHSQTDKPSYLFSMQDLMIDNWISSRNKDSAVDNIYDVLFDSSLLETIYHEAINSFLSRFKDNFKNEELNQNEFFEKLLSYLLNEIKEAIYEDFSNVQYIQPIRARADRFYRVQGINIDEVDSDGLNASMILYSMTPEEAVEFREFCFKFIGYSYSFKKIGNSNESTSMVVVSKNGDMRNLTDVGFGYSQILPIILSIWKTFFNASKKTAKPYKKHTNKVIVIEQPELHLHPAFQEQIMSLIIRLTKAINKAKYINLSFIIETHSEAIVNYLGRQMSENNLTEENLNLYVLNKIEGNTIFDKMEFTSDGYIKNWPIGFFSFEE